MKSTKKTFRPRNPRSLRLLGRAGMALLACITTLVSLNHQAAFAQAKPAQDYLVYVLSEAAAKMSVLSSFRAKHFLLTEGREMGMSCAPLVVAKTNTAAMPGIK